MEATKKDYLKDFPVPSLPKIESEEIQSELQRVARGEKLTLKNPLSSYVNVEAPQGHQDISKPDLWRAKLDQIGVNQMIAEQRRLNLDLEKEYGTKVWQEHLKQYEAMQNAMRDQNESLKGEITEINKKRKFSQISQSDAFSSLTEKLDASYKKN